MTIFIFLIKSIPTLSISNIVKIIKRITGIEILKKRPEIKKELYDGNLWTS